MQFGQSTRKILQNKNIDYFLNKASVLYKNVKKAKITLSGFSSEMNMQ